MGDEALPAAVAEHVGLLELVERDDTALLYEDRSLDCLGWLKTNARPRYEALRVIWRKGKIPGLRELDRAVEQRLKQAAEEVKQGTADEPPPDGAVVIQLGKPLEAARTFISTCHPTLMHHNGDWLAYRDGRYVEIEPLIVDHELSAFLENAVTRVATPTGFTYVPVNPDPSLISTIARMVQIEVVRERGAFAPPCWLEPQTDDPPPGEILACANGLLHLPSGRLLEPDPRFFTTSALPFDYDPDAPEATRWLQALEEWWPASPESRSCLQEIFGYLLVPDTSLQKIFMLIGRSRGGKGTIIRVLVYLLGSLNHASPTMEQLAGRFGMQSMIGKQLAVMTDLYLHKRGGGSRAVENLLRISGEDDVNVERKNKTDWIGRLPTRFLLAATVAPILPDMSGASANRYVPLLIKQTFAENPDPYLFEAKLIPEMPGILNWAVEGWRRLKDRGHFVLTPEGAEVVSNLRALANPVDAFLRERCVVEKGARVLKHDLYQAFERWALSVDGLSYHVMDQSEFTRRLVVASGYAVGETKPRTGAEGKQEYHYSNVRLRDELDDILPDG